MLKAPDHTWVYDHTCMCGHPSGMYNLNNVTKTVLDERARQKENKNYV